MSLPDTLVCLTVDVLSSRKLQHKFIIWGPDVWYGMSCLGGIAADTAFPSEW